MDFIVTTIGYVSLAHYLQIRESSRLCLSHLSSPNQTAIVPFVLDGVAIILPRRSSSRPVDSLTQSSLPWSARPGRSDFFVAPKCQKGRRPWSSACGICVVHFGLLWRCGSTQTLQLSFDRSNFMWKCSNWFCSRCDFALKLVLLVLFSTPKSAKLTNIIPFCI